MSVLVRIALNVPGQIDQRLDFLDRQVHGIHKVTWHKILLCE